jgi:hypothetical protein
MSAAMSALTVFALLSSAIVLVSVLVVIARSG